MIGELVGAALGATVDGLIAFVVAQRALRAANVAGERRVWRDKFRTLAASLHRAKRGKTVDALWRELAVNLNPDDVEDRKLIALARTYPKSRGQQDELTERFARLLKHDWDRVKVETSWWPFRVEQRVKRRPITGDALGTPPVLPPPPATTAPLSR